MCAPFSNLDHVIQPEPITMPSLAEAAGEVHKTALAFSELATQIANEGATAASLSPRGAEGVRTALRRVEEAFIAWRARHRNLLGDMSGTYASETDLTDALNGAMERNAAEINAAAMRRADAALTESQHARGADVLGRVYPARDSDFVSPLAA